MAADYRSWELLKDVIDELIDLTLNYRQSGHPGGSRSKVHMLVALLLSGAMRWDLLRPWRRFSDRLILSAGHTIPLVYATLAALNEVARISAERDGRFAFPEGGRFALTWEDLLLFRRNGGLPGHAEMAGKTLLLKWNTGPSGHGLPPSVGEAVALRAAGLDEVKVFAIEGEGGLTPGASHESRNSAWGLGLGNLVFLLDWNDFGIDENAVSSVVHGTPQDWFGSYGWRVLGTEQGSEWEPVTAAVLEAAARAEGHPPQVPTVAWFKTRKGRGYLKYDYASHGSPHAMNSEPFWKLRKDFMAKYGVRYEGLDGAAPTDAAAVRAQAKANLEIAAAVLRAHPAETAEIAARLRSAAESVPDEIPTFRLGGARARIFRDERLTDAESYPAEMWAKPGESKPNRAGLAVWGAWVNSFARKEYGRPLVIAMSADLAESTNIAGFAKGFGGVEGWGWYNRDLNTQGTLLPQQITEFTNAGIACAIASVNLAEDPFTEFDGFWGACSTYGSFSYLKYGEMRLFSQLAQDCELRVGKVIWVAGHSGPETAEDSRTHFGIFETGVTQLFPDGAVIDLHPWEHNEVPVVLAAALRQTAPIVALHLTRPSVVIPDRAALGMPSHFAAAHGAYVMRPYRDDQPRGGTVFVQGTATTANVVKILPELAGRGLNVKIVAAISPQLLALEDATYRDSVASEADRVDAMVISNRSRRVMRDWIENSVVAEYSLTSDWDDRWRTGGSVDEVVAEAHLSPQHIVAGIERFVADRERRLARIGGAVDRARRGGA